MSLKVHVLETSSDGNSTILDNGHTVIAIDMGLTIKKWKEKAGKHGYSYGEIDAVLITHAHGDHVASSLNGFIQNQSNKKVFVTPNVCSDIVRKCSRTVSRFNADEVSTMVLLQQNRIGTFVVTPIPLVHFGDGTSRINECVGFNIYDTVNDKKYLYATDTNTISHIKAPENGYDLMLLEDNLCEFLREDLYEIGAINEREYESSMWHLSSQSLAVWLLEHNQRNAPVIYMHESHNKKPKDQIKNKDKEFHKEFIWEE